MTATARQTEISLARETGIFVNKGTTEAPNWVLVGCANSVDYGGSAESLTANCLSGKKRISSGDDPEYDVQLQGFVFEYSTANQATNVSAYEFETWFQAGTVKEFKISRPHIGDMVRTFKATISSFRESGQVGELRTYNVALTVSEKPVLSKVPTPS